MIDFQSACTVAERNAKRAERARENPSIQTEYTGVWRQAYDDWMAAYGRYRDCPGRRYASSLIWDLKTASVLPDTNYTNEETRLGPRPSTVAEPIVGMNRQYNAPSRRY
jgi:hypothetical protein